MTAIHSTAPWRSSRGKVLRINSADGVSVCCVHRRGRHGESAEVIANLDLIEAAPYLLAALKKIVEHFGDPLQVADAAIAKANGDR